MFVKSSQVSKIVVKASHVNSWQVKYVVKSQFINHYLQVKLSYKKTCDPNLTRVQVIDSSSQQHKSSHINALQVNYSQVTTHSYFFICKSS